MRDALKLGEESPEDGAAYIKEPHGIEMTRQGFNSYKAQEEARQAKKQTEATPKGKPGRKPKEQAVDRYLAPPPKPATIGEPDLIEAMEAMRPLVASLGAEKVKRLVDLLGWVQAPRQRPLIARGADHGGAMLIYHNFAGEYSGETPGEVMERVYEMGRDRQVKAVPGVAFTKEDWWAYQRRTWMAMRGERLPPEPDAERCLALMVEIGALTEGLKPPKASS